MPSPLTVLEVVAEVSLPCGSFVNTFSDNVKSRFIFLNRIVYINSSLISKKWKDHEAELFFN